MVLSEAPIPLSSSSSSSATNTVLTSKGTLHFMQFLQETWQTCTQQAADIPEKDRSSVSVQHQTALGTEESHHTWMHLHTQKISVLQQPGLVQLDRNHLLTTQHHTQQEVEASWFPHRAFSRRRSLKDRKLQITSLKQFYLPTAGTRGNRYL